MNRFAALAAAVLLGSASCEPAKEPVLQIQFCLTDPAQSAELIAMFREIGRESSMDFVDTSRQADHFIRTTGGNFSSNNYYFLNFGILRSDGLNIVVGSLENNPNQVTVGFFEGHDRSESRAFHRQIVDKLADRWRLVRVPKGEGAAPLTKCD